MKTSLTRSKSSLILLALLCSPVWAKPVAQVTDISGTVFVITPEGKTHTLKVNDHLDMQSEVMVDEGAAVTFNDYYDATYHLTGGSHVKLYDKSLQLKKGKTWVQSQGSRHPLALTTANGHADFWKGEFIATFDQVSSRSQVLVVNGEVEVSNILDKDLKYSVPAGSFTLIDPDVANGTPRAPTKVGLNSLSSALAEFKALPEKPTRSAPARGIASVEAAAPAKGEIIFIKSHRLPASVKGSARAYFKKKIKPQSAHLTHAPIRIYGVEPKHNKALTTVAIPAPAPRVPASVSPVELPKKTAPFGKIDQEFADSLKKEVAEQPKHSKELQSLIEDLKSY